MSDPRLTPDPALASQSRAAQVAVPVADLCRRPDGPRDRQVLFGEQVTVLHEASGWAYVQAEKDGYCGRVRQSALTAPRKATHRVSVPATHAYAAADLKSPDMMHLSFGTRLRPMGQQGQEGRFTLTDAGHVPTGHLAPIDRHEDDPVSVATLLLGTPYLWGGNSALGIDCSGLVQAACLACGIPCPGDSDLQAAGLGLPVTDGSAPRRGDLVFWKGHVAWVAGPDMILYANAHHMAVAYEGLAEAVSRIEAQGGGPVTGHRRPG